MPGAADFAKLGGWECKIHSVVSCPFDDVVLLDADNIPLFDPTELFETHQFRQYGQVFWPDFYYPPHHKYAIRRRAWKELGLEPATGLELESGQVVIDRRRCWNELQIARALTAQTGRSAGRLTWGDKDTFTLAWLLSRRDYYVVPLRPRFIQPGAASVFWQYWSDGRQAFQHQRKWFAPPEEIAGHLLDGELLADQSLKYLREFWRTAREAGQQPALQASLSTKARFIKPPKPAAADRPAELWQRMGNSSLEQGEYSDAVEYLQRAVLAAPRNAAYRVGLAEALNGADRPAEAVPELICALRANGDMPQIHATLGAAMEQLGRFGEAAAAYRNLIRSRPDSFQAHNNLGKTLRKAGEPLDAIKAFERAAHLKPESISAHEGLSQSYQDLGDAERVVFMLRKLAHLKPNEPAVRSSLLYSLHYTADAGPELLYSEHRRWNERFGAHRDLPHNRPRALHDRIRIGYVSPDFRDHTVPRFIGAALKYHDREQFEVFCYSDVSEYDATTHRLRSLVEHWRDIVGLPDEKVGRIIRDDEIDLLVDLRGHAASNRLTLFAQKPAAVQINMVGYFDTTGLSAMDYRLTDGFQDPPGQTERFHTEQLLRMNPTCWCYSADEHAPPVAAPPLDRNRCITFGSLNKIIKVSGQCAGLWAAVLAKVPESRLLLPVSSVSAGAAIGERLAASGIPPDRLELLTKTASRQDYLKRFGQIDIALDTFPFNGITTTCDGLWMGVPFVSLAGATSVSRAGQSILHGIGLGQLSVQTQEDFVRVATRLASDRDALRELRLGMRSRMLASPLMDHVGFTRALELHYCQAWENWRDRRNDS